MVYDALYLARIDYESHASAVIGLIKDRVPRARSVLEVACGTGLYLQYLDAEFEVAGLDRSAEMLAIARSRLPRVPLHERDMRDFDLGRRFDAVVVLFSSIAYITTEAELHATLAACARHLAADGVLIIEPWIEPGRWIDDHMSVDVVEREDLALSRVITSEREGHLVTMHWAFAVGRPGGDAEVYVEAHPTALFSRVQYRAAFEAADLEVEHHPEGLIGRGLWFGRPRT